ncbi:MAG: Two-component sensor histidine kinase [Parcubacteria group bacterium GW2011_GWA2_43_11]|nr:MAG: Two-component sensor histidine kinase [Parcubacteria group bacterium GW2011_GWA2_43_11]
MASNFTKKKTGVNAKDISRLNNSREDKLRFMLESAKILSMKVDFRTWLLEKAKLTVPSLADWCAIDVLIEHNGLERIAVIHQDQKMTDYLFEFEKRFPTTEKNSADLYAVIRTGEAQFVPVVTDETIRQGARSPEHLEAMQRLGLKSLMIIPISALGKTLGALSLGYAESGRVYTQDDFEFFREFCNDLGVILDNGRLSDEISKRDKAKDLFLASLSHELRNPLAPIKSALELLKLRETTTDVREELDVIEHQFDHLAKLLNDLLDVTRFTQAKIEMVPHTLELRKLVERSLKASDALIQMSDITLHFTYPSTPLPVWADDTRLEQAITNLMSNAAKFTPSGGSIWVELSKEVTKENEWAVIKIRDNGEGIRSDDLPNIFEIYYQGRDSSNASGLGIGLALVQKIVELHAGKIFATSEGRSKGSEFVIKLPITDVLNFASEPGSQDSVGNIAQRVLVVDDNVQAADLLVKLMNNLGAHAEAVYSGKDALAHKTLSEYDVILLDIGMPHMDGYDVIHTLRARGIQIPIIALTGYGLREDKQKALDAGFSAHLTKPVGIKDVREALREFLPVAKRLPVS